MSIKVHVQQGLLGKNRITHHTLVDHFGLSSSERRVLGADVALGAGGRLEGHRAAGALVEDLTVSSLDVGFDGVQPSKNHLAARAPVANAPGKVETGLLQMGLEAGLSSDPTALRTDMGRFMFVDPLMGGYGT